MEQKRKVKWGWMGLFIAILVAIFPLFSIANIINSWNESITYGLFDLYPKFYSVSVIDIIISSFLILFSIYAGISLYLRKEDALKKAKFFLVAYLIYGLTVPFFLYFVDFPEESLSFLGGDIFGGIFRSFIFFGIWFWFITSSQTVKRIYFANEDEYKLCPSCGDQVDININICPSCGHIFSAQLSKESEDSNYE